MSQASIIRTAWGCVFGPSAPPLGVVETAESITLTARGRSRVVASDETGLGRRLAEALDDLGSATDTTWTGHRYRCCE